MERKPKPGWKVWHPPPSESSRRAPRWRWTGIEGKTLWEWLELMAPLILSAAIAYLTVTVTQFQFQVQQHAEDQRTKDSALQSYLDQISDQLIDEHNTQLRKLDPDPEVLELFQARTETVFNVLDQDPDRKLSVMTFLSRADLFTRNKPLISFAGIDLRDVDFRGIDLSATDLAYANLDGANFSGVDLSFTTLQGASLRGAIFTDANLTGDDLMNADLSGGELRGANLEGARLTDAVVTKEQLETASSLENATMPHGQKYEDWLKSKD